MCFHCFFPQTILNALWVNSGLWGRSYRREKYEQFLCDKPLLFKPKYYDNVIALLKIVDRYKSRSHIYPCDFTKIVSLFNSKIKEKKILSTLTKWCIIKIRGCACVLSHFRGYLYVNDGLIPPGVELMGKILLRP